MGHDFPKWLLSFLILMTDVSYPSVVQPWHHMHGYLPREEAIYPMVEIMANAMAAAP